jgi:superoxide reductase
MKKGVSPMTNIGSFIQEADWRKEKHSPLIEGPDAVSAGEIFELTVGLSPEIVHPNTTEHHISWITLYFHPEGAKFPHQVGHFEFSAHGESVQGPNLGPVYTHHQVKVSLKVDKPGTLFALSLCNIHGLWGAKQEIGLNP